MPPHFPHARPKQVFLSISWSDNGVFLFFLSPHHDGHSSGDLCSYPSHYLFILFVTIWKFRTLNISLLLRTVMRLRLPTREHHQTLMSRHSETQTWIPSRASIFRPGGTFLSTGKLLQESWSLQGGYYAFALVVWFTQLSCVVVLIYILAITSLIITLYCFILSCSPRHLFKDLLELRVLKEKTNWSFSYCYFWSPPDLKRIF